MKTDAYCEESAKVEFHRASVNVTGTFDIALHTAAPEGDDQRSNEIDLEGYVRAVILRSENDWIVRARKVSNRNTITFPTIRKGKATAKFLSLGIGGKVRRYIKLKEDVDLSANRRVEFEPGDIEIIEDAK